MEMHSNQVKTNRNADDRSLLEQSLAPVWKLTYYGGMLFDWCRPIHRGWLSNTIRCFVVAVALTITIYKLASSWSLLVQSITNSTTINSVVVIMIKSCMQPVVSLTWFLFLFRRRQLLAFFQDWAKLEQVTPRWSIDHSGIKRTSRWTNGFYLAINIYALIVTIYFIVTRENLSDFPPILIISSRFPQLFQSLGFSTVYRIALVFFNFHFSTFSALVDIVPTMVYYHIAKNIEAIDSEMKQHMLNKNPGQNIAVYDDAKGMARIGIHLIWSRFDDVKEMISRADQLFGPIIILNHGVSFFNLCCYVYYLLNWVKIQQKGDAASEKTLLLSWEQIFAAVPLLFIRLFLSIFLISKVVSKSNSLTATVARLSVTRSSSEVNDVNKEERRIIKVFLIQLQSSNGLVACPSSLYTIKLSILPTLISLIVTYSIILLQA